MLDEFVAVLDAFDAEENETEQHGGDEAEDEQRTAGGLCGPDRENDRETAADEDSGVGGTESHIDSFAGGGEVRKIPVAIDQVSAKESAEEHDFGGEEDPHAEAGGIALLLGIGEMMEELGMMLFFVMKSD